MKRILLTLSIALSSAIGFSQVIFSGEAPANIQGAYDMTWGTAAQGWSGPDLLNPANAIIDTLVVVSDVSVTADTLGCLPLTNGADVLGKIAVIYRGSCQFGTKALNAQNAGAIAVVIINNAPGSPVGMAAGDDGGSVTIPVVMISDIAGATLVNQINQGDDVVVFIGNKTGYYPNDIGLQRGKVLRSRGSAMPSILTFDETEYNFQVGAWVYNFGYNDITGVALSANCELGGTSVYSQTSAPLDIASGDSAYITLANFELSNYAQGYYDFFYTVTSDSIDNYAFDNSVPAHFYINETDFSYATYDRDLNVPRSSGGFRSSNALSSYSACIVFRNPNASRVAATGLTFAAVTSVASGVDLDGEPMTLFAYRWEDDFVNLNDAPAQMTQFTEVATGEYYYPSDLQGEMVTGDFDAPFVLENNQRYLFCVTTYNDDLFIGYDPNIDYTINIDTYLQPLFPVESDGQFPILGFGADAVPGIAVKFMDAQFVSVPTEQVEVAINAYPNPASTQVTLNFNENKVSFVEVLNIAGQRVHMQDVNAMDSGAIVNVNQLENGLYLFRIQLENGMSKTLQIVVNH